jgi:hypothetical protein
MDHGKPVRRRARISRPFDSTLPTPSERHCRTVSVDTLTHDLAVPVWGAAGPVVSIGIRPITAPPIAPPTTSIERPTLIQ